MKPQPWSHTRLSNFENCPRQFYEVNVAKRYPFVDTKETIWGREVHKDFELYLLDGRPMRAELQPHVEFLDWFKALPGELGAEARIALDQSMRPCAYFDKTTTVWYRGQVDASKRDRATGKSFLLDHKTGKVKNDFAQLKLFAIHEMLSQPDIHEVRVEYYWTQTRAASGETYRREQLWDLFGEFVPALTRYANAFKTDTWNPKQSGLCNGWCPVTNCEFWRPKRNR